MGTKDLIISFVVVGLFAFAMIMFGISFPIANEAPESLANNSIINKSFGSLASNLTAQQSQAESQKEVFERDDPAIGGDSILVTAVTSVRKVFSSMSLALFNVSIGIVSDVFLGSTFSVVLGVISGIIVILIVLYGWKWIKSGDPS